MRYPSSLPATNDLAGGMRFLLKLPRYLRKSLKTEEAKAILKHRLQNRETRFLTLVKRCIYKYEKSPYLSLLKDAGCEFGDLEKLVKDKGLEGALSDLLRKGVFLRMDEYKGRKPIQRGSTRFIL